MRTDRDPHIGEYDIKTNAICDFSQMPRTSELSRYQAWERRISDTGAVFIARGFSAPDRRPWSIWDDFAEGKPEW
jgi:hypothetical protein